MADDSKKAAGSPGVERLVIEAFAAGESEPVDEARERRRLGWTRGWKVWRCAMTVDRRPSCFGLGSHPETGQRTPMSRCNTCADVVACAALRLALALETLAVNGEDLLARRRASRPTYER